MATSPPHVFHCAGCIESHNQGNLLLYTEEIKSLYCHCYTKTMYASCVCVREMERERACPAETQLCLQLAGGME